MHGQEQFPRWQTAQLWSPSVCSNSLPVNKQTYPKGTAGFYVCLVIKVCPLNGKSNGVSRMQNAQRPIWDTLKLPWKYINIHIHEIEPSVHIGITQISHMPWIYSIYSPKSYLRLQLKTTVLCREKTVLNVYLFQHFVLHSSVQEQPAVGQKSQMFSDETINGI